MFRPARWRGEKNKQIKTVFKLQFHATQVSQLNAEALILSVVPSDVGKPIVRLEKATVKDGRCQWESPVYETVKFTRDPKSGKIFERIYQFIVSKGATKSGFVGEASIDFADHAEATKASLVSLPLENSSIDAVLHVSVMKLQENAGEREEEAIENMKSKFLDKSLRSHLTNGNKDESNQTNESNPAEDALVDKITVHNMGINGAFGGSSGSDITISSSESSSELNTPREIGVSNGVIQQHANGFHSSMNNSLLPKGPKWGWSASADHEVTADSDSEIERLKAELAAITRQTSMSELELQTLRKQIVKESKRNQDLSREINCLKEERDALKSECENLKSFRMKKKLECEDGDLRALLEEIRQELDHEKNLNTNLRLQLQKTQESNEELILAVKDLDEMLEQKNREIGHCHNLGLSENAEFSGEGNSRCETEEDEEQKALEEIVKEHRDTKETYRLEQKILDLSSEIEIYRRDRDELEMQMEQLALDYEIIKQKNHDMSCKLEQNQLQDRLKMQYECSTFPNALELEDKIQILENELEKKSKQFCQSMVTVDELHDQIMSLEEELEKQAREFKADVGIITRAKIEQEQRAIQAEEALQNHEILCKLEKSQLQEQLKIQCKCSTFPHINELENTIQILKNELEKKSKQFSQSMVTVDELHTQIMSLEEELEKKAREFKADVDIITCAKVKQEQRAIQAEEALQNHEISCKLEKSQLREQLKIQCKCSTFPDINELENTIQSLEKELKTQSEQFSQSVSTVNELHSQIESLEVEMEKQAREFKVDLDIITRAKVEQEQRAIRAEEALQKIRWKNANTAGRLQDEFKRLSEQMASTFNANEKVAMKALSEAAELRMEKNQLEEMLRITNTELQLVRDSYKVKLNELSDQIREKANQIQCMAVEIDEKSNQLEDYRKHEKEVGDNIFCEMTKLKSEITRLTMENDRLSENAAQDGTLSEEMERTKKLITEGELVVQRGNMERNELVSELALVKKQLEDSLQELEFLRHSKDEKDATTGNLKAELEVLRVQCNNLKDSLLEDESEKENLRKQIFQLKGDLKKRDSAVTATEKRLKESNGRTVAIPEGARSTTRNSRVVPINSSNKEVANLREKLKSLEGQIKLKEAALEDSASSFLEKEKNFKSKIEELESKLEELYQFSPSVKAPEGAGGITAESVVAGERRKTENSISCTACSSRGKTNLTNGKNGAISDEDVQTKAANAAENILIDLSNELESMVERNKLMENELKELQEKYSEMSLKFAEVEGERQKLVMTLRNLKNSKKI